MHFGLGGRPEERHHLEDLGIKGRILLKLNFKKWDWEAWTGLICIRIWTGFVVACKCSNEISGSINFREFFDYRRTSQLPKKDSAPWSYQ